VVAWISKIDEQDEIDVNRKLLDNLLQILVERCNDLQYVYLQTGTKYYGIHLGESLGLITPAREDQPRIKYPLPHFEQEDLLEKYAKEHDWRYTIGRPPVIFGFTLKNAMNIGNSIAIYATLLKELGEPLVFPYNNKAYHAVREFIDVGLLCNAIEWQANNPHCSGQAFNITNGDTIRTERLWKLVAEYFNMEVKVAEKPFELSEFQNDKKEAWKRIVQKYGLIDTPLEEVTTFEFMEMILDAEWDTISNTNKAYNYGFRERVDTEKKLIDYFDSLKNLRVIPTSFTSDQSAH